MNSIEIGDKVRINNKCLAGDWVGLTATVKARTGPGGENILLVDHGIAPYKNIDFILHESKVDLIAKDTDRLAVLRKEVDSLRNEGYTVSVTVTAPPVPGATVRL